MNNHPKIYVLGSGAVGLALAGHLAVAGRRVTLLRTRPDAVSSRIAHVTVRMANEAFTVPVETDSLSRVRNLRGVIAVTIKSHANRALATALAQKRFSGSLVILQNGLGVEEPFLESVSCPVFRGVLYMASQVTAPAEVAFRQIASSPIGLAKAGNTEWKECAQALATPGFQFHSSDDIQREVWKKSIINAAFNSICPLLQADNGIFARDPGVAGLAEEIVAECVKLAGAYGHQLTEGEVMAQILKISEGSRGVLISTLQDLHHGRPTEIESLNLAMSRLAASVRPSVDVPKTSLLGRLILARSRLSRAPSGGSPANGVAD